MSTVRNRVQLIGNLGKNPELRTTQTGRKWLSVSFATNESYKNSKGEWVTQTQWHNLVAWGKMAEEMEQKLTKGLEISVEGKLQYREYTDKEGNKRNITEIQIMEWALVEKTQAAQTA